MLQYKRIIQTNVIIKTIVDVLVYYPTSANLNYFWNFGSLAGLCLLLQIITGIFLAMHYVPSADLAFLSVEHIMRDVNNGWLLRYLHANGASFFFLVVYIHVFRGVFHSSYFYPRQFLWCSGVIILLLMILTAFLGYVLPWGQMSFWAATVITNLASAVPVIGNKIVFWLWGGFAVDNATLNRFFSLHYLLPFVIAALAILHIVFLHEHGSSSPTGLYPKADNVSFSPYFIVKDLFGFWIFFIVFFFFVFFYPNLLGHTDNYIPANPLVTPTHIVPEWYFLPFYAILRSIPDKLMGVVSLLNSILILLIIPFVFQNEKLNKAFLHSSYHKFLFWIFFFNCLVLGWIGGKSIETPYYEIGQIATIFYFAYFFFILFVDISKNPISILYKKLFSLHLIPYSYFVASSYTLDRQPLKSLKVDIFFFNKLNFLKALFEFYKNYLYFITLENFNFYKNLNSSDILRVLYFNLYEKIFLVNLYKKGDNFFSKYYGKIWYNKLWIIEKIFKN